jgi:sugar (pentulose or hexulose) kinase
MTAPYLLGIDSGTSVVKSVVFDASGSEIAVARRETPLISPQTGWSEADMSAMWEATAQTIAEVVQSVGAQSIAAIGIAGTAAGFWPIDAVGRPVRRAILWNDGRAADIISEWQSNGIYRRIFAVSGNAPFPGYTLSLLNWLSDNEPDVLERTRWLLFHKDWLRYKLTGQIHADQSDVSYCPGDIRSGTYSAELFDLCEVSRWQAKLPPILRSDAVAGEITAEAAAQTGLHAGTPVVAGAVDVVASALGGGVYQPGQACSILGTSFLNSLVVAEPSFQPPESGVQAVLPGGTRLRSLVNTSGTLNLDWLVDNLALEERAAAQSSGRNVFDLIEETVRQVPPGARGIVYLPYLNSAGIISPFAEPTARAQFFGISIEHTRADLMRAIYEGTALAMRDCYDAIGQPVEEVTLVGGGARSAFWSQMFADVTGRRILVTTGSEIGARGAAILAGVGTGYYPSLNEAVRQAVHIAQRYQPQPAYAKAYGAVYEIYRQLYLSARDIWRLRRRVLTELPASANEEAQHAG